MKRIYTFSQRTWAIVLLLSVAIAKAQLSVMASGFYTVGGISDNGIVTLTSNGGGIFKWDAVNGLVNIGGLANGYPSSGVAAISKDGTKIAGTVTNTATNYNEIATYHTAGTSWVPRGGLLPTGWDGSVSSTRGMSSSGNTVVGLASFSAAESHAVKWTSEDGMVDLGSMVAGRSSRANAVDTNGGTIVGWQDQSSGMRSGAKWVDGVESFILDNNGDNVGEALGVSGDGSVIVGMGTYEPYIWSATSGLTYIPHPNSAYSGAATGVSENGQWVVGYFRPWGPAIWGEGFIWSTATGRIELNAYAASLGISTNGVIMSLPLAISRDGTKIGGLGRNASNQQVAFYLDLTAYLAAKDVVKDSNDIAVYPNPAKDVIYIRSKGKTEKAEIYNMPGQKIQEFSSVGDQINVSHLPPGSYILQLSVKGKAPQSIRFIKE